MKFETDGQKRCYERIVPMVKEAFGEFAFPMSEVPAWAIPMGSTLTILSVFPYGDEDAIIHCFSTLVSGARLSADLYEYLLRLNDELRFSAFVITDAGEVGIQHTLWGGMCYKEELINSVRAILFVGDKYDDEIVQRWGGQRFVDKG
jgi:hypothetical protein